MKLRDCFAELYPHSHEVVVVCALGMAANEWWEVTQCENTFYMHGAMGFASSFALGIALTMPDREVWIFDGDGSLCMNLGTLLTASAQAPGNLKHFLVDNRCYQTVGAVPMVDREKSDYGRIAEGAGIRRVFEVETISALAAALPEIRQDGHTFVALRVEEESGPILAPPQPYEGPEMKYRFARAMERRFGVTVFNAEGY
ncbi:thiamine pyrophosphate-dependent enzyme [Afifella pfennigii]|uniref:thiamine pyrophosphate-dependent enzyme n=1 Tax=Afifella pfennigii TaxID=209897 RepID=UPI00068B7FAE|nr:thiamine pyrophosphate-dependent enzyme [Afifella pfennigii]